MDTKDFESVQKKIDLIKRQMPTVYESITARAKELGNDVYADVRAGLRGEVNKFYAFEAGHVVGTPFTDAGVMTDIVRYAVAFDGKAVTFWGVPKPTSASACSRGVEHGAH